MINIIKCLIKQLFVWLGYFVLASILLIPIDIIYKKSYKALTGVTYGLGIYNLDGTIWVPFGDNLSRYKGLYLLPKEIADKRNCTEFQDWQVANIPFLMHGICPWFVYTPYYEVKVNKTNFKIPRERLGWGEVDSMKAQVYRVIIKDFLYPNDPTPNNKGLDPRNVDFSIIGGYTKRDEVDKGRYWQDPIDSAFWKFLKMEPNNEKYEFIPYGYCEEDGYFKYRIRQYLSNGTPVETYYVYTNENINYPKSYIVCSETSPGKRCHSIFPYKDVYVEFSFHRSNLKNRDNIKNRIQQWLDEWLIPAQK